jgi:hypothetical protein
MPAVPLVTDRAARAKLDSLRELFPRRLPIPVEVKQNASEMCGSPRVPSSAMALAAAFALGYASLGLKSPYFQSPAKA